MPYHADADYYATVADGMGALRTPLLFIKVEIAMGAGA